MKRRIALTAALLLGTVMPGHADAGSGRCAQYESLLRTYAPRGGWNVAKMSRTMHRESRCTPWVRSRTQDSGLLQINDVNLAYLTSKMGRPITSAALMDPTTNVQAAALLCQFSKRAFGTCYRPWRGGA